MSDDGTTRKPGSAPSTGEIAKEPASGGLLLAGIGVAAGELEASGELFRALRVLLRLAPAPEEE